MWGSSFYPSTIKSAGSGIRILNLELNKKSDRANNARVSLTDPESIEINRKVGRPSPPFRSFSDDHLWITFDELGGVDPITRALKAMIGLPLIYPEHFRH